MKPARPRPAAVIAVIGVALIPTLPSALTGQVVIDEIHYAPRDKTVAEEFVELVNAGPDPAVLSGWTFSGGIDCRFPDPTVLGPGEYLALAQDPAVLSALFPGIAVAGPFSGRLGNEGDHLVLRDAAGYTTDEVDYRRGFPWPTAGGPEGYSIELIHPDLDNSLGGSWRLSSPAAGQGPTVFVEAGSTWRYREGTSEASSPATAWRETDFDDALWKSGPASIGYGETFIQTPLDMRNNYVSVFLRVDFTVEDPGAIGDLRLAARYDDGFNAWINGVHVALANVPLEEMAFDAPATAAIEDLEFQEFRLPRPVDYLVAGTNILAVELHNSSLGGSSDAFFDARLTGSPSGGGPTPGALNSVFATNAPPQLRQVAHLPEAPASGAPVTITVKATDPDGVASMKLHYQTVNAGSYIRREDPAYETGWSTADMLDDGTGGDAKAGDGTYTAVLPGSVQVHRRLVRYRITASDSTGLSVTVPYPDDLQPNFAFFVDDGVPAWRGASHPGVTPVKTFGAPVMSQLPVYHLIARAEDVTNSQYNSGYEDVQFHGTLVYEGVVHDHIRFENRGEFSTYVSGKNKWRFHLNRGHEFQARDNFGRRYRTSWRTMNFSACASPWVPTNRGMGGLDEAVAFRLFALAGVLSPNTNFLQFRVIDEAVETDPASQYRGDLWGLYMTIEHTDGRFLDERGLPDGNTYKIENGTGDKRNQGPTQSADSSDYNALRDGYNRSQPIEWWRANVDLESYYGFRAVGRAVNDMDLREGWNVCQYHNPATGRWSVMPWDEDMLYMPVTHWSGVMNFQNAVIQHPRLLLEYQARARELIDLLFTPEELDQVVDELAAVENPPGEPSTMIDVDEAMWNYNPRTTGGHQGAFYKNPSVHADFRETITRVLVSADHEGMAWWIKDFVTAGSGIEHYGFLQLEGDARDDAIPRRPTVESIGAPGFPIDDLRFRTGPFGDPQGDGTFGGMEWRLAEVSPPGSPALDPMGPKPHEVQAVWKSGEITAFADTIAIPRHVPRIGATYRVRVRMRDDTDRLSHWSEPVEFAAGPPLSPSLEERSLRVTEVMYHPPGVPDAEFVEIENIGPETVDLGQVSIAGGIEFRFAA